MLFRVPARSQKFERRGGRPAVSLYYRTTLPSWYVGLDDVAVLGDQGVDVGAGYLAQAVELLLAGDLDGVALHVHLDAPGAEPVAEVVAALAALRGREFGSGFHGCSGKQS